MKKKENEHGFQQSQMFFDRSIDAVTYWGGFTGYIHWVLLSCLPNPNQDLEKKNSRIINCVTVNTYKRTFISLIYLQI